MRRYLLLALAVLLAATALEAGSGTDDKDGQIRRAAATGFSGSVLVARSRRVLLERGYGWADAKHTRRTTLGTRYWVASISKQFAAAAILKLRNNSSSFSERNGKLTRSTPPTAKASSTATSSLRTFSSPSAGTRKSSILAWQS